MANEGLKRLKCRTSQEGEVLRSQWTHYGGWKVWGLRNLTMEDERVGG